MVCLCGKKKQKKKKKRVVEKQHGHLSVLKNLNIKKEIIKSIKKL